MFSSLLLASLPGLLLASAAPPAVPGSCPGCPADTDVNEEIVNFVYSELSLGDCQKEAIRVENFQSQVVAGIRYKFDLVAAPGSASDGECGVESCHVEVSQLERTHEIHCVTLSCIVFQVYNVPWMDTTEILWDATSCERQ